tara:strand:+ start:746 stop:907 length:162 start_codon:yes stop_codon:yes gene_type:complete
MENEEGIAAGFCDLDFVKRLEEEELISSIGEIIVRERTGIEIYIVILPMILNR